MDDKQHRRPWRWLVLAGLLFAAAALFMSMAGEPKPPPARVKMPRAMDEEGAERLSRRRTLAAPARLEGGEIRTDEPPRRVDPVIRAMPARVKNAALVAEASALRYAPVGKMLIDCLTKAAGVKLDTLKERFGIDPLVDLDRVSAFDNTFLLTGQFDRARWQQIFDKAKPVALNDHTTLWEPTSGNDFAATWKDQMLIVGPDRNAIEETVRRLEGEGPAQTPIISEADSYGEIYGVVAPEALAAVLATSQPALAARLQQVVTGIQLHVDASHDVGMVLDAKGSGAEAVDFGKAVGAALVMGRLAAGTQGNKSLAEILDYAKVQPDPEGAGFRTELALPLAFLEEKLRHCGQRNPPPAAGASQR